LIIASGSSLRFTTESGDWSNLGESAEYDAQGNNVGLSDPYLVANDPIIDSPGNISFGASPYLSANGGGYVPFARQWYQDGIEVPEYYVRNLLEGSGVGGQFGLLEWSARMSAQVVGTRTTGVRWGQSFTDTRMADGSRSVKWGAFNSALRETNFSTTTTLYNQSWSVSVSLIGELHQTQQNELPSKEALKAEVERKMKSCKEFLQQLFAQLDDIKDAYKNEKGEFDLLAVFDRVDVHEINPKKVAKYGGDFGDIPSGKGSNSIEDGKRYIYYVHQTTGVAGYGNIAFAELLHLSRNKGTYSDPQLDKAVTKVIGEDQAQKRKEELKKQYNGNYYSGALAHNVVNEKCK
jgi:hypothetical protein